MSVNQKRKKAQVVPVRTKPLSPKRIDRVQVVEAIESAEDAEFEYLNSYLSRYSASHQPRWLPIFFVQSEQKDQYG